MNPEQDLFGEDGQAADNWHLLSEQTRLAVSLAVVNALREEGESLTVAEMAEVAGVRERKVREVEMMVLAKALRLHAAKAVPHECPATTAARLSPYAYFLVRRGEQNEKHTNKTDY